MKATSSCPLASRQGDSNKQYLIFILVFRFLCIMNILIIPTDNLEVVSTKVFFHDFSSNADTSHSPINTDTCTPISHSKLFLFLCCRYETSIIKTLQYCSFLVVLQTACKRCSYLLSSTRCLHSHLPRRSLGIFQRRINL